MKISARNQFKGKVVEIRKGAATAHIRVDVGNGVVLTAAITNESVDEMHLSVCDEVVAAIKAADVMLIK